eukprot:gnl/MRDRNA2_/MRDRNA2_122804_c0_seq1.p1 gnl/MRDRNA2_/MRDRNA2_122804_c0~~gnl/MRDRNA2_/MRDRNA2_122804_c0_seq1.p1  ORF type:complete len:545 (+),score=92.49 gnl/MRDRNA2_/MRDRNA2_122804_c0_seq1:79-1713(+)
MADVGDVCNDSDAGCIMVPVLESLYHDQIPPFLANLKRRWQEITGGYEFILKQEIDVQDLLKMYANKPSTFVIVDEEINCAVTIGTDCKRTALLKGLASKPGEPVFPGLVRREIASNMILSETEGFLAGFRIAPEWFTGFVDPLGPDVYPEEMWIKLAAYLHILICDNGQNHSFQSSRYGVAQELHSQQLQFFQGRSLGELRHIVQLALTSEHDGGRGLLRYQPDKTIAPCPLSQSNLLVLAELGFLDGTSSSLTCKGFATGEETQPELHASILVPTEQPKVLPITLPAEPPSSIDSGSLEWLSGLCPTGLTSTMVPSKTVMDCLRCLGDSLACKEISICKPEPPTAFCQTDFPCALPSFEPPASEALSTPEVVEGAASELHTLLQKISLELDLVASHFTMDSCISPFPSELHYSAQFVDHDVELPLAASAKIAHEMCMCASEGSLKRQASESELSTHASSGDEANLHRSPVAQSFAPQFGSSLYTSMWSNSSAMWDPLSMSQRGVGYSHHSTMLGDQQRTPKSHISTDFLQQQNKYNMGLFVE